MRETVASIHAILSVTREEVDKLRGADKDFQGDLNKLRDQMADLHASIAVQQAGLDDLKKRWEESDAAGGQSMALCLQRHSRSSRTWFC